MILVTGGFGSIGAHTALALADLGEQVVVTRHRKAAPPSFLEGRVAVERADLADLEALRAIGDRHEITGIVHLAAVALEEPDAIAFMRRNTAMLLNTLEVARTWRVRRFAVASSIGVYIGAPGPRWREDLALVPATSPNSILAFKRSVEAITPQVLQAPASSRSPCASARSGVPSALPTRRSSRSRDSSPPPCAARLPT
jgi:UDP-glucose 4-epimerase